ncbi:MAG: hypothetical protein IJS61_03420 [Firmicutes bacterium]|nr:hypothetical protein [Bacillota bacterium]
MINKIFVIVNAVQLLVLLMLLVVSGFSWLWLCGFMLGALMLVWNIYDMIKEREK